MSLKKVHALMSENKFAEAKLVLLDLQKKFPDFSLYKLKLEECENSLKPKEVGSRSDDLEINHINEVENTLESVKNVSLSLPESLEDIEAYAAKALGENKLLQAGIAYEKLSKLKGGCVASLCKSAEIDLYLSQYETALQKARESISRDSGYRKAYQVAEQACIELNYFEEANEFFLGQPPVEYLENPRARGRNPTLDKNFILPEVVGSGNDYTHILEKASIFKSSGKPYHLTASIIIPVYNRHQILANTLAALLHQTYPRELMQIIVVDDGSDDAFLDVVKKYETRLDITLARQPDKGFRVAAARNLGIRLSKGDAIVFIDADILPCPTDIEKYMELLHVSDDSVLIGHRRYVDVSSITDDEIAKDISVVTTLPNINPNNDVADYKDESGASLDWRVPTYNKNNYLKNDLWPFTKAAGGNLAISKALIDKGGFVDEAFKAWGCEDGEYGFRMFNSGAYFIPMMDIVSLHQEPLSEASDKESSSEEESFRAVGHKVTQELLKDKCSVPYIRQYQPGRLYEVPKVSIYIPAYNAEQYIVQAVNSCLEQSYKDLEVCICNDGSTDSTLDLLEEHFSENPRVHWVTQENGGIGKSTNTALNMCRGMYIAQLDADDLLLEDAVVSCISVLDNQFFDAVYADCQYIDKDGNYIRNGWCGGEFEEDWLLTGMIATHFRMFRKRLWSRTSGSVNEGIRNAIDLDLWLKLAEKGKIKHIHKKLYSYRWHGKNTSIQHRKAQENNHLKVVEDGFKRRKLDRFWELRSIENPLNPREFKILEKQDLPHVNPKDVILLIPTCEKYAHKMNAVRETWAKDLKGYGYRYLFLLGDENLKHARVYKDVLHVPARDDYESLLLKLALGYKFLNDHYDFDYVYKIDDDCFPNLEKITNEILPQFSGHQYIGGATHPKGTNMNDKWHYGKCSDSTFDKPYKFNVAPFEFAKGGYGYFLRKDVLPWITKEIPTFSKELNEGVYSYEDVRIAEILQGGQINVKKLDGYSVTRDGSALENTLIFDIVEVERFQKYLNEFPKEG